MEHMSHIKARSTRQVCEEDHNQHPHWIKRRVQYSPSPQWPDGQVSDVVYMPLETSAKGAHYRRGATQNRYAIYFRLISYCYELYTMQRDAPVVLIIAVSQIEANVLGSRSESSKVQCLFQYRKETWVKACYIVTKESIHPYLNADPLDAMISLATFFTGGKASLSRSGHSKDPKMQQLYSIANHIFEAYTEEGLLGASMALCEDVVAFSILACSFFLREQQISII